MECVFPILFIRNYLLRERCMALVSLETEEEWNFIRTKMEEVGAPFIWTSGHICDKSVSPR
jgi:hypothetical protein